MAQYYLSNEPKCVQIGSAMSEKQMWAWKRAKFYLRYLNRYISETGSVWQMTYKLDQWLNITFQMSLSVFKSVKPSPRNRCEIEKVRICRLCHLKRYISGIESVRQTTSKLDQWPDITFQISLRVSKSVQPSSRNRCEIEKVRICRLRH